MRHVRRAGCSAPSSRPARSPARPLRRRRAARLRFRRRASMRRAIPPSHRMAVLQRLQRIGQAGFRVVVNGWLFDPSEQQMRAYAQAAAAAESVCCGRSTRRDSRSRTQRKQPPRPLSETGLALRLLDQPGPPGVRRGDHARAAQHVGTTSRTSQGPRPTAHSPAGWSASRRWTLAGRASSSGGICAGGPDANVAWMQDLDIALGSDAYPVFGGSPDPGAHAYTAVQQNVSVLDRVARPPAASRWWRSSPGAGATR